MNGSESLKRVLKIFDAEVELCVDSRALEICKEIRANAKECLETLRRTDVGEKESYERVRNLLEKSIDSLLDEGITKKILGEKAENIGELTGVLCFVVSEIGQCLGEEVDTNDEK